MASRTKEDEQAVNVGMSDTESASSAYRVWVNKVRFENFAPFCLR